MWPTTAFEDSSLDNPGWTGRAEELTFLDAVAAASSRMSYSVAGYAPDGEAVHVVRIGYPSVPTDTELTQKSIILVMALQHGDEGAGRQAALHFLRDLALTQDAGVLNYLRDHPILIIPTASPGSVNQGRTNPNSVDLNRDWIQQSQPEVQAITNVIRQFDPAVVADFHQTNGGSIHVRTLQPTNPEVNPLIATYGETFKNLVNAEINAGGHSTADYGGGTGAGISRNNIALNNRLTLLLEITDELTNLTEKGQASAGVISMNGLLTVHSANVATITKTVAQARLATLQEGESKAAIADPPLNPTPLGYTLAASEFSLAQGNLDNLGAKYYQVLGSSSYYVPLVQTVKKNLPFFLDASSAAAIAVAQAVYSQPALEPVPNLYNVRLLNPSDSEVLDGLFAVPQTTRDISRLEPDTSYQFEVQEQEASALGAWSSPTTFATTVAPVVTYNLEWRDVATQTTTQVTGIADLFYGLSGLSASTDYEFRVQEDDGSSQSAWSGWSPFTTVSVGADQDITVISMQQVTHAEAVSVSQVAMVSGVQSQQFTQTQQAAVPLSALLGSVEAQQLTSAEALDVSIVQPDSLTVAVVEQLLQAEPVSASQSALLDAVIGQSRTQALAVQVAADYTLMAVTSEQLAQVEALEILDGTGLQVVMVEQSTSSETANVTLLALVNGAAAEQGTNANLVVTAATLVITASQAEQLTEAEIADIVGSAMFLDPRELTVSRTTTGFTVRRTTPTYTMQFKHSVH